MQITYPPPKKVPKAQPKPKTWATLFRPRYEYVATLTITALHERIRPLCPSKLFISGPKGTPTFYYSAFSLASHRSVVSNLWGGCTARTTCTGAELSRSQI